LLRTVIGLQRLMIMVHLTMWRSDYISGLCLFAQCLLLTMAK
jgi:hypothetical protein